MGRLEPNQKTVVLEHYETLAIIPHATSKTYLQPAIMINNNRDINLPTKTVLITGAHGGLGSELARQLMAQSCEVIALVRSSSQLGQVEGFCSQAYALDLAKTETIRSELQLIWERHPHINVLINNAALQYDVLLNESSYSDTQIETELDINLLAPILLCRYFVQYLASQPGTIINITSALALVAKRRAAVYQASKAGLHLFTESLRAQFPDLYIAEVFAPTLASKMTAHRKVYKLSTEHAARQILQAVAKGKIHIYPGVACWLPLMLRMAPRLIGKIVRESQ